jgi:hypothetical protein
MSLALAEDRLDDTLQAAITRARNEDIVMFAATPDKGLNEMKSALSVVRERISSDTPRIITACDIYGNLLKTSPRSHFDYMICGEDVDAGRIQFSDAESMIGGSSVSTAIATGIASLTLSCSLYAQNPRIYRMDTEGREQRSLNWRNYLVKQRFDRMVTGDMHATPSNDEKKYVRLNQFCAPTRLDPSFILDDAIVIDQFGGG